MNDITFTKGNGNLGRVLPGEDHISGFLFYTANAAALPTGFGADRIKQITDIYHAESLGITASDATYKVLHYHLSEVFRINPEITLYVMVAEKPAAGSVDFEEMIDLANFANGKIRQVAIWLDVTFATSQVTAIQTVCDTLEADHMPLSVLMTSDFSAVADLTALSDLRALDSEKVSVVLGQDGAGDGNTLWVAVDKTIGSVGACLGALSKAAVSESIAWVKKFNFVTSTELDTPALGEGTLVKDLTTTVLNGINTKGYLFLKKFVGLTGSYLNDNHCATLAISDYAYLDNNRTIDKAVRNIRTYLLPELNSPLRLNADGTLAYDSVKYFESLAKRPLDQMQRDGDLSGFDVYIDPDQNVLSNSTLTVEVNLLINGVARTISVEIGFATSV